MKVLMHRAGAISLLLLMVAFQPVLSQQVKLPRAKSPLLLFGFEGPDALKNWVGSGLAPKLTTKHFSEGTQAMVFSVPKYEPGGVDYPMAIIDWNNGKGYPTKDWSHYGKLAFDAWVDGDKPQELSIELRNKPNANGVSEKFTIEPGKRNAIELSDAMSVADTSNIEEFIFFVGTNRPSSYTVTIDNVRLLPGDKSPLADFSLAYPNYRNLIFPNAKNVKVDIALQTQEYNVDTSSLVVNAIVRGGNKTVTRKARVHGNTVSIFLPASKLPAGTVELTANVMKISGRKILAAKKWTLKKITSTDVRSMRSYIDADNDLIVDGKPFFPIGWYTDSSEKDVDEIAGSPFNCVLAYAVNHKSKAEMLKYLDNIRKKGLKLIYCMNDLYPTATYIKSWDGINGNNAIAKSVIKAYKDNPAVIAWYMVDELPRKLLPSLQDYYHRVSTEDPSHPCYIVLYNMADMPHFASATDVLGADPYPVPTSPLTQVSDETDMTEAAGRGHRAVWMALQAFGWYQYNSSNPDRSHMPSAEELKNGHAPSYEESRCMTYLALTHGAKGILYYCYYDMRDLPQYRDMWNWMKSIGAEVKTLSPMLLSPDDLGTVRCDQPDAEIHTKLKIYDGDLYLMAVNAGKNPCTVTFNIGRKLSGNAKVMFEDRIVKTTGTRLTDSFKPLEAHVYNLGKAF